MLFYALTSTLFVNGDIKAKNLHSLLFSSFETAAGGTRQYENFDNFFSVFCKSFEHTKSLLH
jgi:hypothetical protein